MTCLFCESSSLRMFSRDAYHPYAKWHGPFDFYICQDCGSGQTFPLPSVESLARLYDEFKGGMIPGIRELRDEFPLRKWFDQNVSRAARRHIPALDKEAAFSYMDIGAGNGELVKSISGIYKNSGGIAVDFHDMPQNRFPANFDHWFWAYICFFSQSCTQPSGKYYNFHIF